MKTTFLDLNSRLPSWKRASTSCALCRMILPSIFRTKSSACRKKSAQLTKELYARLSPWQAAQVARHPQRPYTLDYIQAIFTDFHELHGDRAFADDASIVGGLARLNAQPCMLIGHQKGRDTKERAQRNF